MAASATFASHGEAHVKRFYQTYYIHNSPALFGIQGLSPILHDEARFRARSTSHSVAAQGGCTMIPLAAVGAQEDETILEDGLSGHAKVRFVHPDPRTDQVLEDRRIW
jgi:hypothetical protein